MSQPPPWGPSGGDGQPPGPPPPYGQQPGYGSPPPRPGVPRWVWAVVGIGVLALVGVALVTAFVISRVGLDEADGDELARLYQACAEGDMGACDDLFWRSPVGSEYEEFGATCGGRVEDAFSCEGVLP